MTREEVVKGVRGFLTDEFPNRASEVAELGVTAPLFELGLVDSLVPRPREPHRGRVRDLRAAG
jgi:hypothetical protein